MAIHTSGPEWAAGGLTIEGAVSAMGPGPLTEAGLREHVWPLFSRVLGRGEVYLANHSLGRPLDRMAEDVRRALDMWYEDMDGVWTDRGGGGGWMEGISDFRRLVAGLIGCDRWDAVVPKLTAGSALRAVLNALGDGGRVPRVVTTAHEFDSTDFILRTYRSKGRAEVAFCKPGGEMRGVPWYGVGDVIGRIERGVDLVCVCHTVFSTGQVMPGLDEIAGAAREAGALLLVDSYHSMGAQPMRSFGAGSIDADFVTGGCYKYARGGTGACFLAVNPRHLSDDGTPALTTLDTGWFAKKDTFSYARGERVELSAGGDAWLESTPSVLPMFQALSGLEFASAVGVDRLRAYNLEQQAALREAMRGRGLSPLEPEDPGSMGPFALLASEDAPGLSSALREAGVNTDARGGFVRFGPDVLNTAEELARAAETAARVSGV